MGQTLKTLEPTISMMKSISSCSLVKYGRDTVAFWCYILNEGTPYHPHSVINTPGILNEIILENNKKIERKMRVFLRVRRVLAPVGFEDLLAVTDGSLCILHIETDPHGLVHHVEHVDIGVIKDGSHLLQALFTHLQQLTRGCHRVKAASTQAEV